MSYSQFTIGKIKSECGITLVETAGFLAHIPERNYSDFLSKTLEYNIPPLGLSQQGVCGSLCN